MRTLPWRGQRQRKAPATVGGRKGGPRSPHLELKPPRAPVPGALGSRRAWRQTGSGGYSGPRVRANRASGDRRGGGGGAGGGGTRAVSAPSPAHPTIGPAPGWGWGAEAGAEAQGKGIALCTHRALSGALIWWNYPAYPVGHSASPWPASEMRRGWGWSGDRDVNVEWISE